MLFTPMRKQSGLRVVVTFQAFAFAALLFGIRPHGSLASAESVPGRESSLVATSEYLETAFVSQGVKASDGQQSESILITDAFEAGETNQAFLLNISYGQLTYQSSNFGFSLIRSPPIGSPGYRH